MLIRLSEGQSYAGTPTGWTPTLRLGSVQSYLNTTLLPGLKFLEGAYINLTSQQ